jgi:hypothetical protein
MRAHPSPDRFQILSDPHGRGDDHTGIAVGKTVRSAEIVDVDGRTLRAERVGDGACDLRRVAVSRRVDDKNAGHEILHRLSNDPRAREPLHAAIATTAAKEQNRRLAPASPAGWVSCGQDADLFT